MATRVQLPNVTVENAQIRFRNFSGAPDKFNPKGGDRTFALLLDPELATQMIEDGYNVKQLKAREEGDQPQDYIQIKVSYKNRPPRVVLVTSRGREQLDEDMVSILDYAEIANVDLIFSPYHYEVNGRSGVSAYLKNIYVTIEEDELDAKYADLPDNPTSAKSAIGGNINAD